MKTQLKSMAFVVGLIAAFTQSASAQSALYFDRADFLVAAQAVPGHQQSISYFAGPGGSFEIGPILTISDVTFTARYLIASELTSGSALYNFDGFSSLNIHFANGARAFGADFSSQLSPHFSSFSATLSLANGEVLNFTAAADPSSTFFGFISPVPINGLTFSDNGVHPTGMHQEMIANVYVVTVPEPGVFTLLGLGGLLLGWRTCRMRKG